MNRGNRFPGRFMAQSTVYVNQPARSDVPVWPVREPGNVSLNWQDWMEPLNVQIPDNPVIFATGVRLYRRKNDLRNANTGWGWHYDGMWNYSVHGIMFP